MKGLSLVPLTCSIATSSGSSYGFREMPAWAKRLWFCTCSRRSSQIPSGRRFAMHLPGSAAFRSSSLCGNIATLPLIRVIPRIGCRVSRAWRSALSVSLSKAHQPVREGKRHLAVVPQGTGRSVEFLCGYVCRRAAGGRRCFVEMVNCPSRPGDPAARSPTRPQTNRS
jgi:hypothetical protein